MQGQCCMMKNNGISVVVLEQIGAFTSWESVCAFDCNMCFDLGHDTDQIFF